MHACLLIMLLRSLRSLSLLPNLTTQSFHRLNGSRRFVPQSLSSSPSGSGLLFSSLFDANSKKENQRLHKEFRKSRNLQLRDNFKVHSIRLLCDDELRREMKLTKREKGGRVFLDAASSIGEDSLKALKMELHSFYRRLLKDTYLLEASLPVQLGSSDDSDEEILRYPISSSADVDMILKLSQEMFDESEENALPRPAFTLHLSKNPDAPLPPPPPAYLENMDDPRETTTMTMLSFYSFPQPEIGRENLESFALLLNKKFAPFRALGRIYVASEGVNAQMAVPTNVLSNFQECCDSIEALGEFIENGLNLDPIPIPIEMFFEPGVDEITGVKIPPPFKSLTVRVRDKIVAEDLCKPLDWSRAGNDLPPREWHRKLALLSDRSVREEDKPLVLDCRNKYETGVGRFVGAEPLNTENFRESFDVLSERLKDVDKSKPIMTYCTGGIRCVKVGAYLTQELNFTNVNRLAGGIIAYDREMPPPQRKQRRREERET